MTVATPAAATAALPAAGPGHRADDAARIVHLLPGRVRIGLLSLPQQTHRVLEASLRREAGVQSVQANPTTGNILISFSPGRTDANTLLAVVDQLRRSLVEPARDAIISAAVAEATSPETAPLAVAAALAESAPAAPPALAERGRTSATRRARIAVRGLDRDPHLAGRVTSRLRGLPGVRTVHANVLTGRVLVEWVTEHQLDIEDLVSEIADVELPQLPCEDRPEHPLDPAPLVQSAARTGAAALGLAMIVGQRLAGTSEGLVSGPVPAYVSGMIGILQSFPPLRNGIRNLVGPNLSMVVLGGPDVIANALTGSPFGLLLNLATGVRLLTEVIARRTSWKEYEERVASAPSAVPGATIRLDAGERTPLDARVIEGGGTAVGGDGLPVAVGPGARISAGARLSGGPFRVELQAGSAFTPRLERATRARLTLDDHYHRVIGLAAPLFALTVGLLGGSPARAFEGLLLVNPRPSLIGAEGANLGASTRVVRAGVTVVGTRPERKIRRPDVLLIAGARTLTDGVELARLLPLGDDVDPLWVTGVAAAVAEAAGSPWGRGLPEGAAAATDGTFEGGEARAAVAGVRYVLAPPPLGDARVDAALARITVPGEAPLVLYRETPGAGAAGPVPLAILTLRPRLAPGLDQMREECRRARVGPLLVPANEGGHDRDADEALARRAGIPIAPADGSLMAAIDQVQNAGGRVAVLADSAAASEAFAACDLAIALTSGRGGRFPARADLLAPELSAVAAIIDAAARRDAAVRDAVLLSAVSNVIGVVWGIRGGPGVERASRGVYIAALTALSASWARLRGGARTSSVRACLVDPRPERWGRRSVADVLTALHSSPDGVSTAAAEAKQRGRPLRVAAAQGRGRMALAAIADQLRSPMIWLLAGSAGLSLFLGHPADFALIGATILLNVTVGVWQEWQAGSAAEALTRLGSVTARVLRDGVLVTLPAGEVVVGDVLQLASGDRVAADARVIEASRLEVGEAALTGESLPVLKVANGASDAARVVLDGSGITAGAGRAVVFAVGSQTRLGATAAALAIDDTEKSPLGLRLARLLAQFLPIAAGAGVIVAAAGMFRGAAPAPQIALGATLALAAVPEGLPLLAGMAEVAVARRLAGRNALVRRLSAVEALGRVDVACTDKTGTLTEGRLALALVCGEDGCTGGGDPEALEPGGALSPAGRRVLLAGAIASPHPDAPDAVAHLTDVAVVAGAALAGLADTVRAARRDEEASFDPAQRAFHATRAGGRLYVKGAPEVLAPRCTGLDEAQRRRLLDRAEDLARRGLRVLMVAEGADGPVDDPSNLTSLGFLGIRDPLRAGVPDAVRRCREAGIRILMLTGDHPATARAIARDAGLLPLPGDGVDDADGAVLTGAVLAEKCNGDLDEAIDRAVVIARATPLDKLRIIESLQRRGHVVAMTGDGVNDAPALRLADVGVAMGRGGTEVARQAASVVLADDDFATLVEGLVEGRGFWRNMRRALGLLVGGNLGELGLVVGASVLGLAAPLTLRQILAVNLITDALPALSVALQAPEHRRLAGLSREGASALDMSLRRDVVRRGAATAIPALASYGFLLARGTGLPEARSVAFASIVMTQLAQTLRAGWSEGGLTPVVLGAVGGSASLLLAALTIPPLRDVLTLALPSPLGWALIGAGSLTAAIAAGTSGNQQRTVAPSSPRTPRLLPPATPRMIAASSA